MIGAFRQSVDIRTLMLASHAAAFFSFGLKIAFYCLQHFISLATVRCVYHTHKRHCLRIPKIIQIIRRASIPVLAMDRTWSGRIQNLMVHISGNKPVCSSIVYATENNT